MDINVPRWQMRSRRGEDRGVSEEPAICGHAQEAMAGGSVERGSLNQECIALYQVSRTIQSSLLVLLVALEL